MQANGISNASTIGESPATPETSRQVSQHGGADRQISGEQQQQQPQRRRLVQGRPSHARVVSDTNSELSSADDIENDDDDKDASDGDFGAYGNTGANINRPQVAMKAPRTNPAAVSVPRQSLEAPAKRPNYAEDSSASEMSVVSDDADFSMSELEEVDNEEPDNSSDSAAQEEDSSDGNWGSKPRKRKSKKVMPAKTTKRAKGGLVKGSRARGANARAAQSATPKSMVKQREAEYSDSGDSDFYVGSKKAKRGGRSQPKKPKAVPAYMGGSDSDYGSSDYRSVRQSSRGNGVKNYAEDEAEYPGVDFEDEVDPSEHMSKTKSKAKDTLALLDEDGGEDIIEQVRDFRISETAESKRLDVIGNLEFFIKWKGWSYRHATWDSATFLKDYKGYKKVENYFKNTVLLDSAIRNDPDATREDIEQLDINREMERDTLRDYTKIERIVATRPLTSARRARDGEGAAAAPASKSALQADDSVEYLVKWKRLPYSACSWITADEIGDESQAELDSFLDREQSLCLPFRNAPISRAKRPKFQRLTKQPDYLTGGQLRDYQLTSLNWMAHLWCNDENGILADEMGLGKTIQTISFLSYLFHTQEIYGPFLVVVPLSTISAWQREFVRWAPDMNVL
ncbi:ATP-dependent DNA helicase Hrp3, partial [Kickxella alabastrina]